MKIDITIGWTKSALPEYSSFADGYRRGAAQHEETITVDVPDEYVARTPCAEVVSMLAESVFVATNAPALIKNSIPEQIADAIYDTGYRGQGAHYSLSVGDTVTVSEVMLACGPYGWDRVQ